MFGVCGYGGYGDRWDGWCVIGGVSADGWRCCELHRVAVDGGEMLQGWGGIIKGFWKGGVDLGDLDKNVGSSWFFG